MFPHHQRQLFFFTSNNTNKSQQTSLTFKASEKKNPGLTFVAHKNSAYAYVCLFTIHKIVLKCVPDLTLHLINYDLYYFFVHYVKQIYIKECLLSFRSYTNIVTPKVLLFVAFKDS